MARQKDKTSGSSGSKRIVRCVTCNASRKEVEMRFQMPSMGNPTLYACNDGCFRAWQAARVDEMPPMTRERVENGEIG